MKLSKQQEDMRTNDHVQSILLSKSEYSLADTCVMVNAIGFNCFYVDDKGRFYRVRQFNPGSLRKNPRYKNIKSDRYSGIEFVIEY